MFKRTVVLCVSLLLPHAAAADPIISFAGGLVTWEASGVIERSTTVDPRLAHIPVGTPFAWTVTFNPTATFPTIGGTHSDCLAVEFSGSLSLGSTTYSGGSGVAFTNAMLPGSTCSESELTQFTFFNTSKLTTPEGIRFPDVYGFSILGLTYRDLLVQDAFPDAPTGGGLFFMNRANADANGSFEWRVVDVEQPVPVPEPGTLTLFALGAAAVARRVRAQRRGK